MNDTNIERQINAYYDKGFHCAESITMTILDIFDKTGSPVAAKCASGFCGGIGRCHKDVCGALSGGVIALGLLYGRSEGKINIDALCEISALFREKFIARFGSTVCETVKEEVARRDDLESCRDVTSGAAVILHSILKERHG